MMAALHHPQPTHPMPRHDDDDTEAQMSYLPGSGPSLEYDAFATPPGFVTAFWNPYEVKHRRRTSRAQLSVLEHEFDKDPKPNAEKRRSLAAQLNMTPRAIQVWFQNRRAKIKAIKNKIPGGRGMPKLKPGEKAAARANRAAAKADDDDDKTDWVELAPDESPLSSPGDEAFSPATPDGKPQFTIAVPEPTEGPQSAAPSGPPSPAFPAQPDLLAPPSAASMLRRGSAPAPLQGIHRARYSVFNNRQGGNELEVGAPPESPISPPDHEVAPLRRASSGHIGLARRPSLPDSHLRLPSHPYYPHAGGPRMQRRGGLLSPVPDVGHEQEQAHGIPTMLPPAPPVSSSRLYRALPPGMGAVPAAHDLPTQLPARPAVYGSTHTPARPFAVPLAGPLPAADFSFGAPEPGHGDAFNRVMGIDRESAPVSATSEYGPLSSNPDFTHSNHSGDFSQPSNEFNQASNEFGQTSNEFGQTSNEFGQTNEFAAPGGHMWDARTRFGSMASIASDVTGVSVSSTQATSVSGGLGTAGFAQECTDGNTHPAGFSNDRFPSNDRNGLLSDRNGNGLLSDRNSHGLLNDRHSHSFGESAGRFYHPYPAGFQPDVRRASCPGEFLHQFSGMGMGPAPGPSPPNTTSTETTTNPVRPSPLGRSLTIAPDVRGITLVNDAKSLRSPTFPPGHVDPTYPPPPPGPSVGAASGYDEERLSPGGQHMSPTGQHMANGQHMSNGQQHMSSGQQHMPNGQHMASNGQHMSPTGQHMPNQQIPANGQHMAQNGQHMSNGQLHISPTDQMISPTGQTHMSPTAMSPMSQQHMNQSNLSPAQRSLVGGGFGSETSYGMGYDTRTPPSFEASPNLTGVEVMGAGNVDPLAMSMPNKDGPMLFGGENAYDLNAMNLIGQGYMTGSDFAFS